MPWFRTMPWPRAGALAAAWFLGALLAAVLVQFLPLYYAVAEGIAFTIVLMSPFAAGLVHRSWKIPLLVVVYDALLITTIILAVRIISPRGPEGDPRPRSGRVGVPPPAPHQVAAIATAAEGL